MIKCEDCTHFLYENVSVVYVHPTNDFSSLSSTIKKQVSLLVYDVILIEIWREEILPHLLKTESSLSPLMIYSVVSCQNLNNDQTEP